MYHIIAVQVFEGLKDLARVSARITLAYLFIICVHLDYASRLVLKIDAQDVVLNDL